MSSSKSIKDLTRNFFRIEYKQELVSRLEGMRKECSFCDRIDRYQWCECENCVYSRAIKDIIKSLEVVSET